MKYIGVDIGGTKCAVVCGGANGEILKKIRFDTNPAGGYEQTLENILKAVDEMMCRDIEAVGVSCGGPLDSKNGVILSPPNLPGWDEVHITELVGKRTGVPCYLQNDADAGALAEWQMGAGRGYDNVVFLTFGTGMGAGLVLDGRLYTGRNDGAGEIGHVRMERHGPVGYGKAGSFEGFCSGGGIAQLAKAKALACLQQGQGPSFCKSPSELCGVTAYTAAMAAMQADAAAMQVYDTVGRYLGLGLSLLMDVINPDVIILGGIYGRSGALFADVMQRTIREEALCRNICPVFPSELGESIGDAAALCVARYHSMPL